MVYPLVDAANEDPQRFIISDGVTDFTRRAFNDRVNRAIHMMWDMGITPGSAAAIMAVNSCDFAALAIGMALGGVSFVPVNWHLTEDEAGYILKQSGAKVVFSDAEHSGLARKAATRAGGIPVIQFGAEVDGLLAKSVSAEIPDDTLYATPIYFTSGTTGKPKGTRMSQMPQGVTLRQAMAQFTALPSVIGGGKAERPPSHLVTGPMYHAAPLMAGLRTLMQGGQVRIMKRFDAEEALKLIEQYKVTLLMMVPIMFSRMLQLPEAVRKKYDHSSIRSVTHLGAPMPIEVKRKIIDWWGPILSDAYGCSEIGAVSFIGTQEWLKKPGSVGKPIPSFTVQIIGEDNQELPVGEVGLIYMTSLTDVDLLYVDDPEKTKAAHRGPKQFTLGDMGRLDEDGYLYLADRRVDMINSGGVNIYPAEIEAAMLEHPAIADVAVIGVPNKEWGQEVKAIIELRAGHSGSQTLAAEILIWLKDYVGSYKMPKSIEFRASLPRYPNGKLHRRELRDPYWAKQ